MQARGTHDYHDDPRNADILIDINGEYHARNQGNAGALVTEMRYLGGFMKFKTDTVSDKFPDH